MPVSDPIADMLTIIRNGHMAKLAKVKCAYSAMRKGVLSVLKEEGYIRDYNEEEIRKGVKWLNVELKYLEGQPVIRELKRISRPGRRIYTGVKNFPKVYNGLGVSILSTPKGILASHKAKELGVGGELLCTIF